MVYKTMEVMETLLIGATGLLGRNLRLDYEGLLKPTRQELDISNVKSIVKYFKQHDQLDKVILCAAYTNVGKSNQEKELVYNTNVKGVYDIVCTLSTFFGGKPNLVYISSDYVFNGDRGHYRFDEPLDPVIGNYYALTKALGEVAIQSYINSTIIRTSFCRDIGWPYKMAFYDQYTSRDTISTISPIISDIINSYRTGIFHVGTDRKSVYDLARKLSPNITPISRKEITNVTIPYDTSLELRW